MSTSLSEAVAIEYSKRGSSRDSTIFVIPFDMASRGASVQWVSQYPYENELLYPPFTCLTCESVEIKNGIKYLHVRAAISTACPDVSQIQTVTDKLPQTPSKLRSPPKVSPSSLGIVEATKAVRISDDEEKEDLFSIQPTPYYKNTHTSQVVTKFNSFRVNISCPQEVITAISKIDRAWFSSVEMGGCASDNPSVFLEQWESVKAKSKSETLKLYEQNPTRLGFGVNMTTPGLHLLGILAVKETLKRKNLRILDVGASTGYTTLQLLSSCYYLGGSVFDVVGIDHVPEFIKSAKSILAIIQAKSEVAQSFLSRVRFIASDARELNPDRDGKFDIIHTGAAVPLDNVESFKEMLNINGVLVGPVQETADKQAYVKYTKLPSGQVQREELLGVIYTKFISLEEQLKRK